MLALEYFAMPHNWKQNNKKHTHIHYIWHQQQTQQQHRQYKI